MSVNMHLSITIRGFDPQREDAIRRAVAELLRREDLTHDFGPLATREDDRGIHLYAETDPDSPVIVSRSYAWMPEMEAALAAAVAEANGVPCHTEFGGRYEPDEAEAEDEEWEETA